MGLRGGTERRWLAGGARLAAGLLALLAVAAAGADDAPAVRPKRVLIIESYGRDTPPWSAITPSFKHELARRLPGPVEFYEAGPEISREAESQSESVFADYLRSLYAKRPPDLVVPVGAAATQFWWRHRQALFASVPVVIGGLEHRWLQALPLGSNDTAVTANIDITRAGFEPIFELFPATTNVVLLIGTSRLERFWGVECQRAWTPFRDRAQLVLFNTLPFPEIGRRAAALPPRSVLAYWIFWLDAAGVPHEQTQALDQICATANTPVFGMFEEQLGHGIIGGRLFSVEAIGREAARLAARVLGGEPAGQIPPVVLEPGPPLFDWRQLRRWGIDERRLPAGSVVRFRQPSAWERYRWSILGALGIMAAQATTILGLILQRVRRRRAEATAYELAGRLITAQEEERRSIARDLHDDLNQRLALLSVELDVARQGAAQSPLAPKLEEMARQVRELSSEIHKLSYQLHPAKLDQLGLVTAARALCHELSAQSELPIRFADQDVPRELPPQIALSVFRVLQEALGNTLRHAKAAAVQVELRLASRQLLLVVADDGVGFDPAQARRERGLGLVGMEERARLIGGQLRLETGPGRGTRIELVVPLEPAAAAERTAPS